MFLWHNINISSTYASLGKILSGAFSRPPKSAPHVNLTKWVCQCVINFIQTGRDVNLGIRTKLWCWCFTGPRDCKSRRGKKATKLVSFQNCCVANGSHHSFWSTHTEQSASTFTDLPASSSSHLPCQCAICVDRLLSCYHWKERTKEAADIVNFYSFFFFFTCSQHHFMIKYNFDLLTWIV